MVTPASSIRVSVALALDQRLRQPSRADNPPRRAESLPVEAPAKADASHGRGNSGPITGAFHLPVRANTNSPKRFTVSALITNQRHAHASRVRTTLRAVVLPPVSLLASNRASAIHLRDR